MKKAVFGFGKILGNEPGRSVTIIAGGHGTMAGFDPGIEMILHDVTIGAGARIVAKVRPALGVDKRVPSESRRRAEAERRGDGEQSRKLVRRFYSVVPGFRRHI